MTGSDSELYRLRQAMNLSQKEAAWLLGRHGQTISDWERGRKQGAGYEAALRFLRFLYSQASRPPSRPPKGSADWAAIRRIVETPFDLKEESA